MFAPLFGLSNTARRTSGIREGLLIGGMAWAMIVRNERYKEPCMKTTQARPAVRQQPIRKSRTTMAREDSDSALVEPPA
jgi:hypothetical protein